MPACTIPCLALREELLDAACPSWPTTAGLEACPSLKQTATLAETLGTIPEGNSWLVSKNRNVPGRVQRHRNLTP